MIFIKCEESPTKFKCIGVHSWRYIQEKERSVALHNQSVRDHALELSNQDIPAGLTVEQENVWLITHNAAWEGLPPLLRYDPATDRINAIQAHLHVPLPGLINFEL